ncbi:MAG TPA: hypothetical protein VEC60_09320, partial [Reyranella sp.]|nr:hypothetical protein [Reyranella sp.]
FSGSTDLQSYQFEVLHPRELVIYKPVAGVAPQSDRAFIYLALQNNSAQNAPFCFACWDDKAARWDRFLFYDLVPVVEVTSHGAPIVGAPVVRLGGVGGRSLPPGKRFPDIIPDPADFPLNEANYRRDFAIMVQPDRSRIGATGTLEVRVSLARTPGSTVVGTPQIARFRIPVTISEDFRPETMTTEPSGPPQ